MPRPAASGTHWAAGLFAAASCAKAGVASSNAANDIKRYCNLRMVLLLSPVRYTASGWLMLTVLAPSRYAALLLQRRGRPFAANSKLMILRNRQRKIDRREQEEYVGLNHGHAKMQSQKHQWNADRHQREERDGQQIAGKHIGVKTNRQRKNTRKVRDDLN